jgi:hypothetical protein
MIAKAIMTLVCVIGFLGLGREDFKPPMFLFRVAGIIILAVWWSYIAEEIISEKNKKKKDAVRTIRSGHF